jgi:hypothetical protein
MTLSRLDIATASDAIASLDMVKFFAFNPRPIVAEIKFRGGIGTPERALSQELAGVAMRAIHDKALETLSALDVEYSI